MRRIGRMRRTRLQKFTKKISTFLFFKKITLARWQLNIFSVFMLSLGFVIGTYAMVTELVPILRALDETSFTVEQAGDSELTSGTGVGVDISATEVKLGKDDNWYDMGWNLKKQLTVKNLSAVTLPANTPIQVTINTKELFDASDLQNDCDDLRIVHYTGTGAHTELTRSFYKANGATNCSDSTATVVTFPIQAEMIAGASSGNYYLYYNNAGASNPGFGDNGYNIGSAEATMVCPLNGSTTCVDGETPSTATGALRFSGGSAIETDGAWDNPDKITGPTLPSVSQYTIEFFIKNNGNFNSYAGVYGGWGGFDSNDINSHGYSPGMLLNPGSLGMFNPNVDLSDGQWKHLAFVYDGTNYSVFQNGIRLYYAPKIFNVPAQGFYIGARNHYRGFKAIYDEFRISNVARYTANFTSPAGLLTTDANTLVLYHFDENGDDLRNTGKAYDSSGNGYHGTISGAKYVTDTVGVNQASQSPVKGQSIAGHEGILIEEGNTNLITNPSFENTNAYNTNWNLNYFNYNSSVDTFSPGMSKRNSAGPFASGVLNQGKWKETGNGDQLTWTAGSLIGGSFYQNGDLNQGSVAFWITPEWNGTDNFPRDQMILKMSNSWSLYRVANTSTLRLFLPGAKVLDRSVSGWTAGSTYNVVVRWDTRNTLDGTNYICIAIDNINTCGQPLAPGSDTPYGKIGSDSVATDALIEGLTVYRRILHEGNIGTNVGSDNEISQIFNLGSGKDPTLVTGSWDVVFALPTNSSTGVLSTGAGEAWSHPYVSNLLYTNTTNTGGFMLNGTYTSDGWVDVATPSSVNALSTNEKIYSGGYKTVSNSANQGISRSFVATNGGDYVLRALGHSDGTCVPQIRVTRADGTTEISHKNGSISSNRNSPDNYIFSWESPAAESNQIQLTNTASSGTCYWHQVEIYSNLVNNPSLETGGGDPWVPTNWWPASIPVGGTEQENTIVNSGNSSIKHNLNSLNLTIGTNLTTNPANGSYFTFGSMSYGVPSGNGHFRGGPHNYADLQYKSGERSISGQKIPEWHMVSGVYRKTATSVMNMNIGLVEGAGVHPIYSDDVYAFSLNNVDLTVTPASEANSTETSGLRVEGNDTLTQPITGISDQNGIIRFKYTPRHNGADATKFGNNNPYIIDLKGDDNNYIRLYWQSNDALALAFNTGDGVGDRVKVWKASGAIVAGNTYDIEINYSSTRMELKVNGEVKITSSPVTNWWTAGGATGVLAAYQPQGATDLANSLVNKANPGTYDATAGVLPTWSSMVGWQFSGSQWLNSNVNLSNSYTVIVKFSNYISGYAFGTFQLSPSTYVMELTPSGVTYRNSGTAYTVFPPMTSGTLSMDRTTGYRNGFQELVHSQSLSSASIPFYIGARNNGGSMQGPASGRIQALAVYANALTSAQVDAVSSAMTMISPIDFAIVPTTAYFGSKSDGTQQGDVTIKNFTTMTPTESTSSPLPKFGTKSVKLTNAGTQGDDYTTEIDPNATGGHTLSAYVYNSTSGDVGETVSATIAKLVFAGVVVTPQQYIDMGGGWWRISYMGTVTDTPMLYGVHVMGGKTVIIDAVQLEAKATTTGPLQSSYTDGSLGTNYSWSGESNNSTSSRSGGALRYPNGGKTNGNSGTVSFWYKPTVDFGFSRSTVYMLFTSSGTDNTNNSLAIRIDSGRNLLFGIKNAEGVNYQISTGSFSADVLDKEKWYHMLMSWDGTNIKAFINNIQYGSDVPYTGTITLDSANLSIGSATNWTSGWGYFSDFRIYNKDLDNNGINYIYQSGLSNHTQGQPDDKKYKTTADYESGVLDLGNAGQWGLSPNLLTTEVLNGNTINYQTRSSEDNLVWSDYTSVTGTNPNLAISSQPERYLQIKATLNSPNQNTTPQFSGAQINYVQDAVPPETNATETVMKRTVSGDTIAEDNYTNSQAPFFSWIDGDDDEEGSGLRGYCLYLGPDIAGNPANDKGILGSSPGSIANTTCPFVVPTNSIDFANANLRGNTWLQSSTDPYYLVIRAVDNTGNVYELEPEIFSFYFDNTPPTNPSGLFAPASYQRSFDSFIISWPADGTNMAKDTHSQVKGFQYKLGNSGTWYGGSHTGLQDCNDLLTTTSYALDSNHDVLPSGETPFYFRTVDNACNTSASAISAILKYNSTAPSAPRDLEVTPSTNDKNEFAFRWETPEIFSGSVDNLSYCYTVNTLPSSGTCIFTSSKSLNPDAFATQPGENTFYVVTRDEASNINYGDHSSIKFYANTSAPGVPRNLDVADISVKTSKNWRLTISWDEPEDLGAGVAKYFVYRSFAENANCSEDFTKFGKVGETAGGSYVDTNLQQKDHYYCIRACDSTNNCSAVSSTGDNYPDGKFTSPATLESAPVVSSVSTRSAKISWITDRDSDSRISYGLASKDYLKEEVGNSEQRIDHELILTNLEPGTQYYFQSKWTDEDGNLGLSDEYTFKTAPPPSVKDVVVSSVGISTAVISFTTTGSTTANLYYGTSTAFGSSKEVSTSPLESRYTALLDGLSEGTKYFFQLETLDAEEYRYPGDIYSFNTLPQPKLTNVRIQQVKNAAQPTILVSWESNTEVTSVVSLNPEGKADALREEVNLELLSGEHQMIIRGLFPNTVYELTVKGSDKLGNQATSTAQRLTTATDTRPATISNLQTETGKGSVTDSAQLIVTWETDEPTTSQVEYGEGTGTSYGQKSQMDSNLTLNHTVVISGLTPGKVYHLRAIATDEARNTTESLDYVAITPKAVNSAIELVMSSLSAVFSFLR